MHDILNQLFEIRRKIIVSIFTLIVTNILITLNAGSGIYAGKMGPVVTYHPMKTSNALVIGEVQKHHRRENPVENTKKSTVHVFSHAEVPTISGIPPRVNLSRNFKDGLLPYASELLDVKKSSVHVTTLCDRDLCCDFHIETNYDVEKAGKPGANQYRYNFVLYYGNRSKKIEKF